MVTELERIILFFITFIVVYFTFPFSIKELTPIFKTFKGIIACIFVVTICLQFLGIWDFPLPFTSVDPEITALGMLLLLTGTILAVWARLTSDINGENVTGVDNTRERTLITYGPYAFTHNPTYLGYLAIFVGLELTLHSYLIFISIPLYLVIFRLIKSEETALENKFGNLSQMKK
jgi:protein-S-isoprenylcysteine O-methyltransferase Ste14